MKKFQKTTLLLSKMLLLLLLVSIVACDDGNGVSEPIPPESEQVENPVGDEVTTRVDLYVAESADSCATDLTTVEREVTYREGEVIAATLNELFMLDSSDGVNNALADSSLSVADVSVDTVGEAQTILIQVDGTPDFPTDPCAQEQFAAQIVETVRGLSQPTNGVSITFDGETPDWLLSYMSSSSGE